MSPERQKVLWYPSYRHKTENQNENSLRVPASSSMEARKVSWFLPPEKTRGENQPQRCAGHCLLGNQSLVDQCGGTMTT